MLPALPDGCPKISKEPRLEEERHRSRRRSFSRLKESSIPVPAHFPAGRATRLSARTFVIFLVEELGAHPF